MKLSSSARRRRLLLAGLGTAALAAWAWPSQARACSCEPRVDIRYPLPDAVVSANDYVIINSDCGGSTDELRVLIDGQEGSLQPDPDGLLGLGFRIVPEPAPGARVEIEGCPGWSSCEEAAEAFGVDEPFGKVSVQFTVTDRDESAPASPRLLALDYVLGESEFAGCDEFEQPRPFREWTLDLQGEGPDPQLLYHVSLGPDGDDDPTVRSRLALGQEQLELIVRRYEEDAGQEVCATVRTFDLAGNEGEQVSTCQQLDRNETLDGQQGCACTSAAGGAKDRSGLLGGGLMLLLGGWARRRRRT